MDVSNARFQSDVYNSFIANCRAAQQSDIFYHAVRRLHGTVCVSASMLCCLTVWGLATAQCQQMYDFHLKALMDDYMSQVGRPRRAASSTDALTRKHVIPQNFSVDQMCTRINFCGSGVAKSKRAKRK